MTMFENSAGISGRGFRKLWELWLAVGTMLAPTVMALVTKIIQEAWGGKVETSLAEAVLNSPKLMIGAAEFGLAVLGVHLALATVIWRLWMPFADGVKLAGKMRVRAALFFFLCIQAGLLGFNTILFPASNFLTIAFPGLFAALSILLVAGICGWHLIRALHWANARLVGKNFKQAAVGSVVLLLLVSVLFSPSEAVISPVARKQPDIILVGIDCLRPDHLSAVRREDSITPNLDAFLKNASVVERAYTPLSRTFPAWLSILTGRYPINHGGRYNLSKPSRIQNIQKSLPFVLRQHGYSTAYAIDESRFSNIDESYGFDHVLTPQIGAADFLFTRFADMPIVNLLSRTPAYRSLFPNEFRNRAAFVTYDPASFENGLDELVGTVESEKPLFLATHFELAHWPFHWRDSKHHVAPENARFDAKSPRDYQKALHRVDQQFQNLINSLKRHGRLENAIVVVLSDHGEGFAEYGALWKPASAQDTMRLPPFALHGLNVLDEAQTRVVLGFRIFGSRRPPSIPGTGTLASLVDLAPSVFGLAGLSTKGMDMDGCDLFSRTVERACGNARSIPIESGFYVPAMTKVGGVDEREVAREAQGFYDVTPEGRLIIKDSVYEELLRVKQRAAIGDQWIVASIPDGERSQFLFGRLDLRVYWNAETVSELPGGGELERVLGDFCRFYSNDDQKVKAFCTDHYPYHRSSMIGGAEQIVAPA